MGYFLFFLVGFLLLTMLLIWPVFPFVIIGMLLAYIFYPVNNWLRSKVSSPMFRASLLTVIAMITFALPVTLVVREVSHELGSTLQPERAHELVEQAQVWLVNHHAATIAGWLSDLGDQARDYLVQSIPFLFGSAFRIGLGAFVCLVVFYYFTKEGEEIWSAFLTALPLPGDLKSEMNRSIAEVVRAIIYGQALTAFIQGLLGGLGLLIFQVPGPALLTVLMTLLAFFPFVGTPLIWGPAGVFKLMTGNTWQGIGLLIYGAVMVANVDNVLKPRLIARHSEVHPLVILLGIIGGTEIFGFIGFLIGPVIFAIFLHLLRFFGETRPADTPVIAEPVG